MARLAVVDSSNGDMSWVTLAIIVNTWIHESRKRVTQSTLTCKNSGTVQAVSVAIRARIRVTEESTIALALLRSWRWSTVKGCGELAGKAMIRA
jgi:hypothetical protein